MPTSGSELIRTCAMAGRFLMGNLTAATDLKSWKWIKLGTVAFLDLAQVSRHYPGQAVPRVLADAVIGIEGGSPFIPSQRFTITWGRDTRTNRNVFYLATSFR